MIDSASDFLNPGMKKCISISGLKEFDIFPDSIDSNSMNMELFFWFKMIGSVPPPPLQPEEGSFLVGSFYPIPRHLDFLVPLFED